MSTNHIIHSSDGDTYDLTTNRYTWFMLPEDVQKAMQDWPHGWKIAVTRDEWADISPSWGNYNIYRAKPAPRVTEHVLHWSAGEAALNVRYSDHTHRITIRYSDDTLPAGEYKGPDGAAFIVEELR